MKLVKIEHERCNEYDTCSYVWAPETKTQEEIQSDVDAAQSEYLEMLKQFRAKFPTPISSINNPPLNSLPRNLTVGEILDIQASEEERYSQYSKQRELLSNFESFLYIRGYVGFHERHSDVACTLNWGHRHADPLQYGTETPDLFTLLEG